MGGEDLSPGLSPNLQKVGGIVAFVGASLTLIPVAISSFGAPTGPLEAARRNSAAMFALAVVCACLALILCALYTIIRRTTRPSRRNKADLLLVASVLFAVAGLGFAAISTIPPKDRYPAVQVIWLPANTGAKLTITGDGLRPYGFGLVVEGLPSPSPRQKRSRLMTARIYPDQSGEINWSADLNTLAGHKFVLVTVRRDDDEKADCLETSFAYADESEGGLPVCLLAAVPPIPSD